MALTKQAVTINFQAGLDLKTDPYQVQVSNFLNLNNSVFTTTGRLTKRYGFKSLTTLPNTQQCTLTTFNGNLAATGSSLYAYSADSNQWLNQGIVQPVQLNTLPLIRTGASQSSPDTVVSASGLVCITYIEAGQAYYVISDSVTGQQIVKRTALPTTAVFPRVFVLGVYFIVMFIDTAGSSSIQYIAIPISNPTNPKPVATFANNVNSLTVGWDGYVTNNTLYVAYQSSTGVEINLLTSSLGSGTGNTIAGATATLMSVYATSTVIWIVYWNGTNAYSAAFNYSLVQIMATTQATGFLTPQAVPHITSVAVGNVQTIFIEIPNTYGYDSNIVTNYIFTTTMTLPVTGTGIGTPGPETVMLRSVGLASKAFIADNGTIYMFVSYGDTALTPASDDSNQPTFFLVDSLGNIYLKLAYSNGGGYVKTQVLPSITNIDDEYYVAYLKNDFLATVNKGTNLPTGTQINAIYTQSGINLASFSLNNTQQYSVETAGTLNLTGGILWEYDGVTPVENNFNVWPENVEVTTSTTGGGITASTYFYVFTYEWTNNQGNIERSAPSIPVSVTTTGSTSTNTIYVPTNRLTYKTGSNPIRIVGYRWSTAQEVYYQFTSVTVPVLNTSGTTATWTDGTNTDTSATQADYTTIIDRFPDSSILGNVILYTTGGVVENIGAPPSIASALFDNRVWLIDAEDQNLLWYSKQVIENVPVEMSDLLTFYVAPTTSAQGSTGYLTAIYPMDDKLILFKKDAIYYINGTGPDNTGSNSQYSSPVFITAAVGTSNIHSIVLTPNGLMFQSDKGIWLLGRDLSTNYIGAPVEMYNGTPVLSATAVPATTQVRFILNNSVTLMYDYFFNQWATHSNILAISSTLYQNTHTYLNSLGQVFQEATNTYMDGSEPVLMSLTTAWINVAGLQGFERFYHGNLLGTYYTPFLLNATLAYDYNSSATQAIQILPQNYSPNYGGENNWGSGQSWGGPGNVFSARFWPNKQKCQSFQLSLQEVYNPAYGQTSGQGLTLSGISLTIGVKRGWRTQSAAKSFGSNQGG